MSKETHSKTTAGIAEPTSLFCSAEWHLARLKERCAVAIYNLALRLSNGNEKQFCASIPTLQTYFDLDYTTIWRAIQALRHAGFFVVLKEEPGKSVVYRVLTHKEWVEENQSHDCTEKLEYPWTGEEADRLGVELHAASNQRVKVFPSHLKALRATGLPDAEIVLAWRRFLETDRPTGRRWKGAIHCFLKSLRASQGATA